MKMNYLKNLKGEKKKNIDTDVPSGFYYLVSCAKKCKVLDAHEILSCDRKV